MYTIRPAVLNDVPQIKDCAKAAYEKYVSRIGKEPAPMQANFARQLSSHQIDVLELNKSVSGYIVYQIRDTELMLENVAVQPHESGRGLGRALINHVEKTAKEENVKRIILYTNEAMTENIAMYPKLGFTETARVQEDGFNRVYFEKLLA